MHFQLGDGFFFFFLGDGFYRVFAYILQNIWTTCVCQKLKCEDKMC